MPQLTYAPISQQVAPSHVSPTLWPQSLPPSKHMLRERGENLSQIDFLCMFSSKHVDFMPLNTCRIPDCQHVDDMDVFDTLLLIAVLTCWYGTLAWAGVTRCTTYSTRVMDMFIHRHVPLRQSDNLVDLLRVDNVEYAEDDEVPVPRVR